MNHIKLLMLSLLLSLTSIHTVSSSTLSGPETEAGAVLLRYFDALTQGDTATVRALMGGDLLEKRSRLLDNPTYPTHLINTYGQAHFEINRYNTLDNDTISIDATIFLSPDESIKKRYLLKKELQTNITRSQFLIYEESTEKE